MEPERGDNTREGAQTEAKTGHDTVDRGSARDKRGLSLAERYEALRERAFDRLREYVCSEGSQRATGLRSSGRLSNRATGEASDSSAFDSSSSPVSTINTGDTLGANVLEPRTLVRELAVVDLTSTDLGHLAHSTLVRVEYDCDTGDAKGRFNEQMLDILQNDKVEAAKTIVEYVQFGLGHGSFSARLTEAMSLEKGKLVGELSTTADANAATVEYWSQLNAAAFKAGITDWAMGRDARTGFEGPGSNARCNMPDFSASPINRTFK
jgi:hypothetical protein